MSPTPLAVDVRPAMFRCKCGRVFRAEVAQIGANFVRPAGVPYAGETDARPIAPCPSCGAFRYGQPVVGRHKPEITCGAKCRSATGPACDCSCAGANHGSNH